MNSTCPLSGIKSNLRSLDHTLQLLCAGVVFFAVPLLAQSASNVYEAKPKAPYFAKFNPRQAPAPGPLLLQEVGRLAIIGDSITEQKMYSRIIETYLTVYVPELKLTARQFGWSGETAEDFRKRMTNDCLRFQPTLAKLCYGMNDSRYRPCDVVNGAWYASNYTAVVQGLKDSGRARLAGLHQQSRRLD